MTKRCISTLFSLLVDAKYNSLSQNSKGQIIKQYKEAIYKSFSPIKDLSTPEQKRNHFRFVFEVINGKFDKVDTAQKKELPSFYKLKNLFLGWSNELATVADEDLDDFADAIVQQTEQAFVIALVVSVIVVITVIAIIIACCVKPGGRVVVRGGVRVRNRSCVDQFSDIVVSVLVLVLEVEEIEFVAEHNR